MEITITINTDRTEDIKVKIDKVAKDDHVYSRYAKFFDVENKNWRYNFNDNMIFLRLTEHYFNELLRLNGKVYLNDVYEALGFSRVDEYENLVGWTYKRGNPAADDYIDFGLYDVCRQCYAPWNTKYQMLLDFNVESGIDRF